MRMPRLLRAVVVLLVSSIASLARADGFRVDPYDAPSLPADLLWAERADPMMDSVDPYARLTTFYSHNPLAAVNSNDTSERHYVIASQFGLQASLGLALHRRFLAGLTLGLAAQSSRADEIGLAKPSGFGFGSPGIDGRFILFDRSDVLEAALAATVFVPIGSTSSFQADDGVRAVPRVILSRALFGNGVLTGSLGVDLHGKATYVNLETGPAMVFRLGLLVPVGSGWGATAELGESSVFDKFFKTAYTPVEGTLGARFGGDSGIVAHLGAGVGLTEGVGTPAFRLLASLAYAPPPSKPAPKAPASEPAPAAPVQADSDRDHDGVANDVDRCPDQPEDRDGFQDTDGCPDPDNDGDGIADGADKCPNEPEDHDGFQDADGCPDPDNDGDGIPDASDQCPNIPETKNGFKDDDGCPDYVRVESSQIRTLEPIYFDTKSDHIQTRSEGLLTELAGVIKARPDLGRISVDGHTDARGGAAYNLQLSTRRAASVQRFLIEAGVPEERLESHGFGQTKPIASNDTDAGRALNRRVEFRLVETPPTETAPKTPENTSPGPGPKKP